MRKKRWHFKRSFSAHMRATTAPVRGISPRRAIPPEKPRAPRHLGVVHVPLTVKERRIRDLSPEDVPHEDVANFLLIEIRRQAPLVELAGMAAVGDPPVVHHRVDAVSPDQIEEIFQGII